MILLLYNKFGSDFKEDIELLFFPINFFQNEAGFLFLVINKKRETEKGIGWKKKEERERKR
jgi:hypothetical protein